LYRFVISEEEWDRGEMEDSKGGIPSKLERKSLPDKTNISFFYFFARSIRYPYRIFPMISHLPLGHPGSNDCPYSFQVQGFHFLSFNTQLVYISNPEIKFGR
jgi:hypothetical protein